MLFYNIRIALKSLRRNPYLTALVIGAIAIGICISTTFLALEYVFEKDPLPGQSQNLHFVRIDGWDPARHYDASDPSSLPAMLSYRDYREISRSGIPTRQTPTYFAMMFVHPDPKIGRPYQENIRFASSDFFPMFRVPFLYGSGWDRGIDAKREQVVVIDRATNDKLFGGANSVGREIRIDDKNFRVVGVIDTWRPAFRPYDLVSNQLAAPEAIYMPFEYGIANEIRTTGNRDNWKPFDGNTYEAMLQSETTWLPYWVELPTVEKQQAYRDLLRNHILEQKKVGRFQRPLHFELTNMLDLRKEMNVTPTQVSAMSIVSVLFLVVCSINLVGLLLGKFLGRIPEISVRRALGASRFQVFWQHIVECEVIGIIGGVIGMGLATGVLELIAKLLPNGDAVAMSGEMFVASIFLSLIAGLVAGIYPAWRVCTVPPAMQLKLQ
ncbi:MAG: ABC transporter permease [Thermoanaerobaculia bacterium]